MSPIADEQYTDVVAALKTKTVSTSAIESLRISVQHMSQHIDESIHLYNGYRALKCGDYAFGHEHPPLAKMLVAIPLLWSNAAI